ncbi:CaiB/BaiF CoA transferase family protein [Nocardia nova]|uniref:CaiB/BaiF CoA transferase family protein n=1 Tax=Nocardia nova TaxID=37330 RepID=UPI002481FA3C|nr:CoA transferase [Nocardia nova]
MTVDSTRHDTPAGPLDHLTVIDLSTTLPGAQATMFLADAGAEVIFVEPPSGSRLRALPGWPALGRGKKSITLDPHDDADAATLRGLLRTADVLVTTMRPAAATRLGVDPATVGALNPRLVSAAITGWGSTGPFKDLKGYEALVMAKLGIMYGKRQTTTRPGPSFVPSPFASWGAAQTAIHGILAALLEREDSGAGQHVEADLVRGIATMDTWQWFSELVVDRWPDAFVPVSAFDDEGNPNGHLIYPLLVTPTRDGHFIQFAQTEPRLFLALMKELDLTWMFTDPKWADLPQLEDVALRIELWEIMLERASARTLAEWQQVFDTNPDLSAEVFRTPADALHHPQLAHDGRVVTITDPDLGEVTQPSTLVHVNGAALAPPRLAPRPGADTDELVRRVAESPSVPTPSGAVRADLPLAGITILELGSMFAGPYAATLLADLGARVLKVEPLGGDTIRGLVPFPEAGGAKVMQGKESIALDMHSPEGLAIVHRLAQQADVVLQTYRAGAAERAGVDAATLTALNPRLVYLCAPGYGIDGPYGGKPAYAPSIGAATGLGLTDVPDVVARADNLDEVKAAVIRLYAAAANLSVQADGVAALGAASAMLLGLLARRLGRPLGTLTTTMIATGTHALVDRNVDYPGRGEVLRPDPDMYGYSALYRLYRAADGWIFLAAPLEHEWAALIAAMEPHLRLAEDPRFATAIARIDNDDALAEALARVFATRAKALWEKELGAADVGCVAVAEQVAEKTLQEDEFFEAGYGVLAVHPTFDVHRRLSPATTFSRSRTKADGGCLTGEHTDALLTEIGYDTAKIADLRARGIVA